MNKLYIWLRTLEPDRRTEILLKAYRLSKFAIDEARNIEFVIEAHQKSQEENRVAMGSRYSSTKIISNIYL